MIWETVCQCASTFYRQWAKELDPPWGQGRVSPSTPMLVWEKVHGLASILDCRWAKELAPLWRQGGVSPLDLCWFGRRFVGGLHLGLSAGKGVGSSVGTGQGFSVSTHVGFLGEDSSVGFNIGS